MGLGMTIIILVLLLKLNHHCTTFLSNLLVSASHDQVPQHCPPSSVTNGDEECMHKLSGQDSKILGR